jgi:hypothetical protein
MLELPEPIYETLLAEARARGVSPAEWIAERLPRAVGRVVSGGEVRASRERLWRHVVSTGRATGTNNEQIDADLARAYGGPHEEEPGNGGDS